MNAPSSELIERLSNTLQAQTDHLIELRRQLHAHPELSQHEFETTRTMVARLQELGFTTFVRPEGTGFYADLTPVGFDPEIHPTIAIRSDIDALPINELNDVPYKSQNPGVMHACGHDVHMATVFGSALGLLDLKDHLPGRLRLIYQHAEETVPGGATEMVDFGAIDGVDAVLGLHCDPELPIGRVGVRPGPFTASFDLFELTIEGKGGHGARPHQCTDPIFVGTQVANALYQLPAHNFDARIPAVITLGSFQAGAVANVIPESASLSGSIRTISPEHRDQLDDLLRRIIGGICLAHGASYELKLIRGAPAIHNDPYLTDAITEIATDILGDQGIYRIPLPSMGGEDFSVYCERVPGAMFRLGTGARAPRNFLHSPHFNIDERALTIGASILARTALRLLHEKALEKKTDRMVRPL
ncbi:amidohydrolase [Lujinxingia litoralis]|uniref:Amidohydrolase n=1 Tax=Lujinxingia litoralis TaxID=2211119 RepID=A0A328C478_9DELT|nr:amidohydrolase [Lujinxingia litoralis]RAL20749.1 amidohydrolase [Lujinxingia litoralis]